MNTTLGGVHTTQLFDLENDPLEQHNLSGSTAQAQTLARLRTLLQEQRILFGDNDAFWRDAPEEHPVPTNGPARSQ